MGNFVKIHRKFCKNVIKLGKKCKKMDQKSLKKWWKCAYNMKLFFRKLGKKLIKIDEKCWKLIRNHEKMLNNGENWPKSCKKINKND